MKQRILVAVIGIPALLGVLCFAPDWATALLVSLLCVIGCHEFMAAAAPLKARRWWLFAAALSVVLLLVTALVMLIYRRAGGKASDMTLL